VLSLILAVETCSDIWTRVAPSPRANVDGILDGEGNRPPISPIVKLKYQGHIKNLQDDEVLRLRRRQDFIGSKDDSSFTIDHGTA
jgi:hypothetical protein